MRIGAVALAVIIAAQGVPAAHGQVPSQRELNGFLIGQHKDAIAASFFSVLRVDTTADGWIYRTYPLDAPHHAYMSFKFPHDRLDYAISVQIAGDSGTPMVPFVGLVLGTHRDALEATLGKPSRIEHQSDVNTDLYEYGDRNYSVEVDARGRVTSIQIFGEQDFPQLPAGAAPSLDSLVTALQAGGDAALQYLAPDLEVYQGGKAITFRRAALVDLETKTSEVAAVLFHGPHSVLAILGNPDVRNQADIDLRVWPRGGSGWVWKFSPPVPISELVFKASAGRWRVWEVRYR